MTADGRSVFWGDGNAMELGYILKGWSLQDVNCVSFGLESTEPLNSTWPGAAPTNLTSCFCTVHAGELQPQNQDGSVKGQQNANPHAVRCAGGAQSQSHECPPGWRGLRIQGTVVKLKNECHGSDWYSSVGWASSRKAKGRRLDFGSGPPGQGACERQPVDVSHIDVSLSHFLPPFPSL